MHFNIRGAIIHNIKRMNENDLMHMIQDSIQQGDEKFLPGLGVLFEVIWNHSDPDQREHMIQILYDQANQNEESTPFT